MKQLILVFAGLAWILQGVAQQDNHQKMDELVTAYANNGQFNGAVLVAQQGNVLFQKAYGLKDAEQRKPNAINSIFQIGSITKQFTAAVIMQLVQERKLSLQDTLGKFFKGFPNGHKITIEHLLTHTSGMFNYTGDTNIMKRDVTRHYSRDEMIGIFQGYRSDFEPGTKWNYSNSGYSMLGYIIEKVTGKPYEQVMRKRIFRPLGMNQTGFDFTHLKDTNRTKGYFALDGSAAVPAPIVDSTIAYSAGAMYSTLGDLLKWDRAIYSSKILKPQTWKTVFTPYKNKYGYGWAIDSIYKRPAVMHSGGIHGFASYIMRFPEQELVVIAIDNASGTTLGRMSRDLAAIALGELYKIPEVRKQTSLSADVLKQYVGEYQLAPTFIITVRLSGNQLKAQATNQPEFDIYPEKENIFFLKVVEAKVEFARNEKGEVSELILHQNGMKQKGKKIK